jgi:hypothetical protein
LGVRWIEANRLAQQSLGVAKGVPGPLELNRIARAQNEIVSLNLLGAFACG